MIQYATPSVRGTGRFQKFYKRLKKRKGHSKAIVATARRMLATVFVLLTRGCEYVEMDERNTRKKLISMDMMAREISGVFLETSLYQLSDNARDVQMGERSITIQDRLSFREACLYGASKI